MRALGLPFVLQNWLAARTRRERLLLVAALGLGLCWLAVTQVWVPLQRQRASLVEQIARQTRLLGVLTALPSAPAPVGPDARPVASILSETADGFDLSIRRLDPLEQGAELVLDGAGFEALILWLDALEAEHGLRLTALELTRRPEPGQVSARFSVRRGQP